MNKKLMDGMAVFFMAVTSFAAGFSLNEESARGSAMGGALIGSPGDAAANAFNPAGLTELNGTHTLLGCAFLRPEIDCRVNGHTSHMNTEWYELPQLYASQQLLDNLYFGFGLYSEFGLGSGWDHDWALHANSTKTSLQTMTLNPNLAYKVTDRLSLATGFRAVWLDFTHKRVTYANTPLAGTPYGTIYGDMASRIHGDSWGYGWMAAMQYKLLDNLQFGAVYRSHVLQNVSGHLTADSEMRLEDRAIANTSLPEGYSHAKGDIDLPPSFSTGLNYQPTRDWNLGGSIIYTQWSKYDWLCMSFGEMPSARMPDMKEEKDWDDVFRFSLGAEYAFLENWKVLWGYVYDLDPIKSTHTDTMIPPGDRHMFSVGLGYLLCGWALSTGYTYTYVDEVKRMIDGHDVSFQNGCCHIISLCASKGF